jgi:hypothetical protein
MAEVAMGGSGGSGGDGNSGEGIDRLGSRMEIMDDEGNGQ